MSRERNMARVRSRMVSVDPQTGRYRVEDSRPFGWNQPHTSGSAAAQKATNLRRAAIVRAVARRQATK